jgi:aconitate hydratase
MAAQESGQEQNPDTPHNLFDTLQEFSFVDDDGQTRTGRFYSLPQLEQAGVGPVGNFGQHRIVLESVLRNYDNKRVTENDVRTLANWQPNTERTEEIPFVVARTVLQDFTGVPLLVDLAAMRSQAARLNKQPGIIEPLVPVDLIVDHSVRWTFRGAQRAATQHGDGVQAQPGALPTAQVGHAGL